jgi:hypothetical protein
MCFGSGERRDTSRAEFGIDKFGTCRILKQLTTSDSSSARDSSASKIRRVFSVIGGGFGTYCPLAESVTLALLAEKEA